MAGLHFYGFYLQFNPDCGIRSHDCVIKFNQIYKQFENKLVKEYQSKAFLQVPALLGILKLFSRNWHYHSWDLVRYLKGKVENFEGS